MLNTARRPLSAGATVEAVAKSLEYDILFGELRPRTRLVEDELMDRFRAKRHVVRQALVELERMGAVVRVPNRGAAVREFTAQEVEEIYDIREVLQRHAVLRMRLPADEALLARLTELQRRHDDAVSTRDPRQIHAANEAFHAALFEPCDNRELSELVSRYNFLSRAMRLYPMVDASLLERLRSEHRGMIEALRSGDRERLTELLMQHMQHSKKVYLCVREAVADDAEGL